MRPAIITVLAATCSHAAAQWSCPSPNGPLSTFVCEVVGNYTNMPPDMKLIQDVKLPSGNRQITAVVKDCKKDSKTEKGAAECLKWQNDAVSPQLHLSW